MQEAQQPERFASNNKDRENSSCVNNANKKIIKIDNKEIWTRLNCVYYYKVFLNSFCKYAIHALSNMLQL